MLPIWLLAAMMIMMYYWRFWEPWANAMLAILLPKLWFGLKSWLAQLFLHVFLGSPLLDPKKLQNEQFYIIDWIRKKLLVDVANLAPCCHDDYGVLLEVLGTLGNCYVSNPVAKTLVWIENHDWHNCFAYLPGLTLTGPKKASKRTVLHNRLNKEKTPGRCANLAPCCHDDYDVLLEVWEPWANAMLAILLPKLWFGLKSMTGTTVFACLPGAHPYWTQKSFKTNSLYNRLNKEKTPGRCCHLAPCCHDDYDVLLEGFGNPGQMLCWQSCCQTLVWMKIMTGTTVFACLPGAHPYWTQKSFKTNSFTYRLKKEKTPGRCCQSGSLLPWWLWCTIGGFGNPGHMLC